MVNNMIDVDKLLKLDYLKEFVTKFNEKIQEEEVRRLESYSLDMILSMEEKEIREIFNKYGLKCDSIIEKKDSVFLDETWEFYQLFKEDLMFSSPTTLLQVAVKVHSAPSVTTKSPTVLSGSLI
jgi:hypothetical protein